jgi:hypothetical protein
MSVQRPGAPVRRTCMRSALLLVLPLTVACGGGSDRVATAGPETDLRVEVSRGEGAAPESWRLTCGPVGGDHPDAQRACEDLAGAQEALQPLPDDRICTEQWGGPQTARVSGTVDGEPVDVELSRVNGCHIAQWDALGSVLPGPVGVEEPGVREPGVPGPDGVGPDGVGPDVGGPDVGGPDVDGPTPDQLDEDPGEGGGTGPTSGSPATG